MLELVLAWRNIWRHRRRTWLTVGAMVFSNILLVFLISFQLGTYQLMIDNALSVFSGHIQLQAPGYQDEPTIRNTLPAVQSLAEDLRHRLPDASISARAMGFALASSQERSYGVQVVGVEPEMEKSVSTLPGLITSGRYLTLEDQQSVVIGATLARNLKIKVGDELTLLGSAWDGSFAADVLTVVGIFSVGIPDVERAMVQMPLSRFQETFALGKRGHSIVMVLDKFSDIENRLKQLQNLFSKQNNIAVLDWNDLQPGLRQAIQADMSSAGFMYGLLVILVAFSVMNTQLMSVLERTREFGIVMSLGLRSGRLARLVLLETALMASLGMIIGIGCGAALTLVLSHTGFTYPGLEEMAERFNLPDRMYPELSLLSAVLGPMVVFIGSLFAALYPALRLHLLKPIDAMRAV
jgi:ABC-type lipoprotein release transport system permease subunit